MPGRRERVPRDDAAPARSEVLPADPVDIGCVGGTLPQKAGVLLVEATVPLAVGVPTSFNEADLAVHARASETEPRASQTEPVALHVPAAAVTRAPVSATLHDAPIRHPVMAGGDAVS